MAEEGRDDLKKELDELNAMLAANAAAHEAATRRLLIDIATQHVDEIARALEGWSQILGEACRAMLEFSKAANTPAIRQWRIYDEYFGIWHGEN